MVRECSGTEYSACQPCTTGFYQREWTKGTHCNRHSACDSGEFDVIKAGDQVNDVVCLCKEGKHCANRDCEVCRHDDVCPPGSGAKTPGDRKYNGTVCEECEDGFYSNVSSSTEPCRKWTSCASFGLIEAHAGSLKADVECSVPLHDTGCCRGAVIPLALFLIIFIALFVCSLLGYLNTPVNAIRRLMNRGDGEGDPQRGAQEAGLLHGIPTAESGLHTGIQEEGKDSRPSEEEEENHVASPIGMIICVQDANGSAGR
ncbi:tumor necrosis factor receptor superfamily member 5-like isoform X2 [Rhinoraja longicauda]